MTLDDIMTMRNDLLQYYGTMVEDGQPYLDLVHFHQGLIKKLQKEAES